MFGLITKMIYLLTINQTNMLSKEEVIFEPVATPNQNWVKDLDRRHMDSSLKSFRAPKNAKRVITLC